MSHKLRRFQPPPTLEESRIRRADILQLVQKHDASNVRIFGSVARGDTHPESDIDFLVAFNKRASIWDAIGLWQDLSKLLGHEVSLITESTLKGAFKENVLKDVILL